MIPRMVVSLPADTKLRRRRRRAAARGAVEAALLALSVPWGRPRTRAPLPCLLRALRPPSVAWARGTRRLSRITSGDTLTELSLCTRPQGSRVELFHVATVNSHLSPRLSFVRLHGPKMQKGARLTRHRALTPLRSPLSVDSTQSRRLSARPSDPRGPSASPPRRSHPRPRLLSLPARTRGDVHPQSKTQRLPSVCRVSAALTLPPRRRSAARAERRRRAAAAAEGFGGGGGIARRRGWWGAMGRRGGRARAECDGAPDLPMLQGQGGLSLRCERPRCEEAARPGGLRGLLAGEKMESRSAPESRSARAGFH